MFRRLISAISEDDNPRLHRIPFLLFWISSYALAWLLIYIYENPLWDWLCKFSLWLKGGYGLTTVWREELFIGLLMGLTLSAMQTWLLKRRYGFVPKYWWIATIVGGMISGFGYIRLGNWVGGGETIANYKYIYLDDVLIWFVAINMFQMIVMFFTTGKRALWIALVGIVSGCVTIAIIFSDLPYIGDEEMAIVIGTVTQAISTGLVMLYLMAHSCQGIIPKRDNSEKLKRSLDERIHPVTFVALWIAIYYASQTVILLLDRMNFLYRLPFYSTDNSLIFLVVMGSILGIAQQWLIKYYMGRTVYHWQWVTIFAWLLVGILWILLENSFTHAMAWFIIPTLLQAFLINRTMKYGWIWIVTGISAGMIANSMYSFRVIEYYDKYFRHQFLGGFILSVTTALIFVWLTSRQEKTKIDIETATE